MNLYMILYYYTGNSVIYQIEFMEVNMKIRLMKYIKKYSTMIMVCSLCLNAAFIAIIDGMRDSAEQAFDQLIIAESKMSDIKHDLEDLKAEQEVEQAEAK